MILIIVARHAYHGVLTDASHRAAKRQRARNSRRMHLGAAMLGRRRKIQRCWAVHTVAATNSLLLAGYALGLHAVLGGLLPAAMQQMIDYLLCQAAVFAQHITQWTSLDELLYNIPLTKWLYRREFCPRQHFRLLSLMDDMTAKKMSSVSVRELQQLYNHFGLREFVMAHNETDLLIGTDKWRNGRELCYCIHPEELFL